MNNKNGGGIIQAKYKSAIVGWVCGVAMMAILLWFWNYLDKDSNTLTMLATVVTALATAALAYITYRYVILTNSILEEQSITRKINTIEKKLENFYIPLQQHILSNQYVDAEEMIRNDTINKEFMKKYLHLCQNEEIRSNLKKFLDRRLTLQNELHNCRVLVDTNIQTLEEELKVLQDKT